MENSHESADKSDMTMLIGGIEELFARLPVALYRSAPDGELLAGNPALADLLGYPSIAEFEAAIGSLLYCEGALMDVTEKVKAKKARDEFVATVSHELRNPISVILGLTQELASDYDGFSDAERREIADVIARQSDDASWIIEDLLVAYREDMSSVTVATETFDVVDEIRRVLEGVDKEIDLRVGEGARMVTADPRRTRQILRILVCDDGRPLDENEAQRIFEPYERGSGLLDARSVGLGLSVARKLAGLMNGYLVYRHVDGFSSFVVTLPAAL
jgi:two-component system, OmpR family, phosphate regulon sensor histidine kinase PhoR